MTPSTRPKHSAAVRVASAVAHEGLSMTQLIWKPFFWLASVAGGFFLLLILLGGHGVSFTLIVVLVLMLVGGRYLFRKYDAVLKRTEEIAKDD